MRNPALVHHIPIVIIKMILFLFQIAILAARMSASFQKDDRDAWKMYVRIAINSVAPAQAQ
jgi:hypothetical protein